MIGQKAGLEFTNASIHPLIETFDPNLDSEYKIGVEESAHLEAQSIQFINEPSNKYRLAYFISAKEYSKSNPKQPFQIECNDLVEVFLIATSYFAGFSIYQNPNPNGTYTLILAPNNAGRGYPGFQKVEFSHLGSDEYDTILNTGDFTEEEQAYFTKKSKSKPLYQRSKKILDLASKVGLSASPSFIPIVGRGITQGLNMTSKIQRNGRYFTQLSYVEGVSDLIENAKKIAKGLEAVSFGDNFEWVQYCNVTIDQTTMLPAVKCIDISSTAVNNTNATDYLKEAARLENGFSGMTPLTNALSKVITFKISSKSEEKAFLEIKNILIPLYRIIGDPALFNVLQTQGYISFTYSEIFDQAGNINFQLVTYLLSQMSQLAISNPALFKSIFYAHSQYAYALLDLKNVNNIANIELDTKRSVRTMQSKTATEFALAGAAAGLGIDTVAQGLFSAVEVIGHRMGVRKARKNINKLNQTDFKDKSFEEIRTETVESMESLSKETLKDAALSAAFEIVIGKLLISEGIFQGSSAGKVADYASRIAYAALATMPQIKSLVGQKSLDQENTFRIMQFVLADEDVRNKFLTILSGTSIGASLFSATNALEDSILNTQIIESPGVKPVGVKESDLQSIPSNSISSKRTSDVLGKSVTNQLDYFNQIEPVNVPAGFTHLRGDYQQMLVNSSLGDRVTSLEHLNNIVVPWNGDNAGVFPFRGNHYQIAFEALDSNTSNTIPSFLINWNGQGVDYINYLNDASGIRISTGTREYIGGITLQDGPNTILVFARDIPNGRFHLAYMGPINTDPYSTTDAFRGYSLDSVAVQLVYQQNWYQYLQSNMFRIPFNSRFNTIVEPIAPVSVQPILVEPPGVPLQPMPIIPPTSPAGNTEIEDLLIPNNAQSSTRFNFDAPLLGYISDPSITPKDIEVIIKNVSPNPVFTQTADLMVLENNNAKTLENLLRFQTLMRFSQDNIEIFLRDGNHTPEYFEDALTLSRFFGLTPASTQFADLRNTTLPANSPFSLFLNQLVDEFAKNNTKNQVDAILPEIRSYLDNGITFDEGLRIFDILNLESQSGEIIDYINANPQEFAMSDLIQNLLNDFTNETSIQRIVESISSQVDLPQVGVIALFVLLVAGAAFIGVREYPKFSKVNKDQIPNTNPNQYNPPSNPPTDTPTPTATPPNTPAVNLGTQVPPTQPVDSTTPTPPSSTQGGSDQSDSSSGGDAQRSNILSGIRDSISGVVDSVTSSVNDLINRSDLDSEKNPVGYNLNEFKRAEKNASDKDFVIPVDKNKTETLSNLIYKYVQEFLDKKRILTKTHKDYEDLDKRLNDDKFVNELIIYVQQKFNDLIKTAIEKNYPFKSMVKVYSLVSTNSKNGIRSLLPLNQFRALVKKHLRDEYQKGSESNTPAKT